MPYNEFAKLDSKGFLWISSNDGVYQFDGLNLNYFDSSNPKFTGFKGKNIQSDFFEDSRGNIWFTTVNAINCYLRM